MSGNGELVLRALGRNLTALDEAMELCLNEKLIVPTLILFYSSIDALGSLDRSDSESARASFLRWTDAYLLKARSLPCTALELYAARCGVLHALSADADLIRAGKARPLVYAWGAAPTNKLQKTVDLVRELRGTPGFVAVHITDLREAFREGCDLFLTDARSDPVRYERVLDRARRWFSNVEPPRVDRFLNVAAPRGDA